MIRRPYTAVLAGLVAVLAAAPAGGAAPTTRPAKPRTPSADEIARKAHKVAFGQGRDRSARLTLTVTAPGGVRTQYKMTVLRRRSGAAAKATRRPRPTSRPATGSTAPATAPSRTPAGKGVIGPARIPRLKLLLCLHAPPTVNRRTFLIWSYGATADRWTYRPRWPGPRRIPLIDKPYRLLGSDVWLRELTDWHKDGDRYLLLETSRNYYQLRHTPADPKAAGFAYANRWILRSAYVTQRIDYYDHSGIRRRQYNLLRWRRIQGRPTVVKAELRDLKTTGRTLLEYADIRYDRFLPESIFTKQSMMRPPRQYLLPR